MCGRFASSSRAVANLSTALRVRVRVVEALENQAPGTRAPVALSRPGGLCIESLPWGVPPPWRGPPLLLARSETVATKPVFRELLQQRRCLVPAEAFYEWQVGTSPKQPWRFARADGEPLAMAGLWQAWRDETGRQVEGFLLLTTAANPTVAPRHDRMPVILVPAAWKGWLNPEVPALSLLPLLRPWAEPMTAWPVTTALNRADYAGPATRVEAPLWQAELFGASAGSDPAASDPGA